VEGWRRPDPLPEGRPPGQVRRGQGPVRVRVRHGGDRAWIAVKGPHTGISRAEFECEIPLGEAEEILPLRALPHIEKVRHILRHGGPAWAIDIHQGLLAGAAFAEVALAHPEQPVALPPWVGEEVTHDPRYRKATLLSRSAALKKTGF
jgi:adenylate cyclase